MSNVSTTTAAIYQAVLDSLNSSGECGVLPPAPPGKSAYEVAVDNGFVGSEKQWLDSLQYEQQQEIARLEARIVGNEKFTKDSKYAASKLVGTGAGQVPLAQDLRSIMYSQQPAAQTPDITDADELASGSYYQIHPNLLNGPSFNSYDISTMAVRSGKVQEAYGFLADRYAYRILKKFGGWSPWMEPANRSDLGTAASKDVGTETGNVMEVGAYGLGSSSGSMTIDADSVGTAKNSFCSLNRDIGNGLPNVGYSFSGIYRRTSAGGTALALPYPHSSAINLMGYHFVSFDALDGKVIQVATIYTNKNTTVVNGSLKPSSPVVKIHTDSLELNDDAERMGVTLNKRGVGDYLLQNTTGLRDDDGWYIELPQDVNGNPYFAVTYDQLENNDIEVKTYKRIFDMSTFMFGPDLDSPVDIKEGRSIAIRFNDLPQEKIDETEPVEEPIADEEEVPVEEAPKD